jgi:predicted  nucleic acid-binding Zn-ribbon protein
MTATEEADLRKELEDLREAFRELKVRSALEVSEANHRMEATRAVMTALLKSVGPRAVKRPRFQELIAQESRSTPNHGPAAVRHEVLLEEARRVLSMQRR